MHNVTYFPALRLALPLVAGMIVSGSVDGAGFLCWLLPLLAACCAALSVYVPGSDCGGPFYGVLFYGMSFLCGTGLGFIGDGEAAPEWPAEACVYRGVACDWPSERERSVRLCLESVRSDGFEGGEVYLYVPKDSAARGVRPGDCVEFYGVVKRPDTAYAVNADGSLWCGSGRWHTVEGARSCRLRFRMMELRRKAVERYRGWGLDGDELAVVAAVALGDRHLLDDGLRGTYSMSGASHLLAVSGLHVGILYSVLLALFPAFMAVGRLRTLKEVVVLSALWTYAFLIGMPVSIVRTLVMFSLFAAGRCTERESSSVNGLAVAAVVILAVDPSALHDVGFRLSFLAVAGIVAFRPLISGLLHPQGRVISVLWDMTTVSVAAQMGTAPLGVHLFSDFPMFFLLTNVVAIPMMYAVVVLALAVWCVSWCAPVAGAVARVLALSVRAENGFLEFVSGIPGASVTLDMADGYKVWMAYAVMVLLYFYLSARKTKCAVVAAGVVAVWCCLPFVTE